VNSLGKIILFVKGPYLPYCFFYICLATSFKVLNKIQNTGGKGEASNSGKFLFRILSSVHRLKAISLLFFTLFKCGMIVIQLNIGEL
jgi:hypothetical protein